MSHRKRSAEESAGRHYGVARADRFESRHLTASAQQRKKAARKAAKRARAKNR